MLDKAQKEALIKKFRIHESDSGSAEVQVAILTEEIKELTGHLKAHKKDFSSRRGLLRKVSQRRRLLKFLKKDNPESYEILTKKLKLKKGEEELQEFENKINAPALPEDEFSLPHGEESEEHKITPETEE